MTWAFLDISLVYLCTWFLWAIVAALMNRFYLNLRRVAYATAAALLTNASIREHPAGHGPVPAARVHDLIEIGNPRRGAQSPWADFDEEKVTINIVKNGDVDEMMMIEAERQRAVERNWYHNQSPHGAHELQEPISVRHQGVVDIA